MPVQTHLVTAKQWKAFQMKFKSGEVDHHDPAYKTIVKGYYETRFLEFAKIFFPEHVKDSASHEFTPFSTFHEDLADFLLDPTNLRLAIAAPRGHAKSTFVSFFYILHQSLYQKKKNIVIVSSSEDMAVRFLRRIKTELEHNRSLQFIFGVQKSQKWAETEIILDNGVTINAKGRGAQLRGLISGSHRPDLIVCDDLEDEELVRSEVRRADLAAWFDSTVGPTLEPKTGQLVFIGTILHQDSLLNNVLTKYKEFKTAKYAALKEDDTPLWPERFSKDFLHKIREAYIERHQLPQFYMEYMNDPTPEEAAVFHLDQFQFFKDEDLPPKQHLTIEMAVDLGGGSTRTQADDTAFVVTATDRFNKVYVLDVWNDTIGTDVDRLLDQFFILHQEHHPQTIIIEKTIATNFLIASLEREQLKRNTFLPLRYVNPPRGSGGAKGTMSDAKFQRISALAAPTRNGLILYRASQHKLFQQAASFPRAKHDDMLDALAYIWMFGHRSIESTENPDEIEETYQPLYGNEIGL